MRKSENFSTKLVFHHSSGDRLYPVRMRNRDSGVNAFRIAIGSNTKADHIEIENEEEINRAALAGKKIRCSSLDRKRKGIYGINSKCIQSFERI